MVSKCESKKYSSEGHFYLTFLCEANWTSCHVNHQMVDCWVSFPGWHILTSGLVKCQKSEKNKEIRNYRQRQETSTPFLPIQVSLTINFHPLCCFALLCLPCVIWLDMLKSVLWCWEGRCAMTDSHKKRISLIPFKYAKNLINEPVL